MILGIRGKASSGKDTVARFLREDHGWASLAFADPIKCFVRDCWGLPDEVLWGPSKLRSLIIWECGCGWVGVAHGEEGPCCHDPSWKPLDVWVYDKCSWYSPTAPVKGIALIPEAGFDTEVLWPHCGRGCSGPSLASRPLTVRLALQTLGTEWGRGLDDSVWVRMGIRRAKLILANKNSMHDYHVPFCRQVHYPPGTREDEGSVFGVVLTDCRFVNEADAIRAAGGEVWQVTRPDVDVDIGGIAGHTSETEQDAIVPNRIINNDGTLEDLRTAVEKLLKEVRTP